MGKGRPLIGRHPNFKTGKVTTSHGYVIVFVGKSHHLSDCRGYAYEHRINAEFKIGRRLLRTEFVHHKNGIKSDNRRVNLAVYPSRAHHFEQHRKVLNSGKKKPDQKNYLIKCKCGCSRKLWKFDSLNRPRKYIHGHNSQSKP